MLSDHLQNGTKASLIPSLPAYVQQQASPKSTASLQTQHSLGQISGKADAEQRSHSNQFRVEDRHQETVHLSGFEMGISMPSDIVISGAREKFRASPCRSSSSEQVRLHAIER